MKREFLKNTDEKRIHNGLPKNIGNAITWAVLVLVALLSKGWVCVCEARWLAIAEKETVLFSDERWLWASPVPPYRLVMYDHSSFTPSDENPVPFLQWEHPRFIPLVKIPANPKFPFSFRHAATLESTLSDRLYANLRLKMLLEEYQRIQRKAQEFLSMLRPDQDTRQTTLLTPGLLSYVSDEFSSLSESLPDDAEKLVREFRRTAADAVAPGGTTADQERLAALSDHPAAYTRGAPFSGKKELHQPLSSPENVERADVGGAQRDAEERLKVAHGSEEGPLKPFIGIERPLDEDAELPWIFRFILKTFTFVMKNKLEILAGTLAGFAVLFLILSIRASRRR